MKKAIIFGAGYMGNCAYFKLKKYYEIIAYTDNNPALGGKMLNGINIICPDKMKAMYDQYNPDDIDIIICSGYYNEIVSQICNMGITHLLVMAEGFLFKHSPEEMMIPMELEETQYVKKNDPKERTMLFVQDAACIRTHKIAAIMKTAGYRVYLLYTMAPPESGNKEFSDIYEQVFTVFSMKQLVGFVENSEFDIVHSSNAPDNLTALLLLTTKKIVHDTHDMMSLWGKATQETLIVEYIANTKAAGVIYTSQGVKDIATSKFGISEDRTFVLENMPLQSICGKKNHRKLSEEDGEIHCVYEGGISSNAASDRYFEDIWRALADEGIHVHFYSGQIIEYCKALEKTNHFFHYEGNYTSKQLAEEMGKYDCGLALFHVTQENKIFLETSTANKMYEYLNAGLPVAVGDIKSYIRFVETYQVGAFLDISVNIREQLRKISRITVSPTCLKDNGLLMDTKARELTQFYEKIINS